MIATVNYIDISMLKWYQAKINQNHAASSEQPESYAKASDEKYAEEKDNPVITGWKNGE